MIRFPTIENDVSNFGKLNQKKKISTTSNQLNMNLVDETVQESISQPQGNFPLQNHCMSPQSLPSQETPFIPNQHLPYQQPLNNHSPPQPAASPFPEDQGRMVPFGTHQMAAYDSNMTNRGLLNMHLHHRPAMDSALAKNIELRTAFAKFVGFLIFIVLLACIAVIVVDSKNEYENMVLDEQLKIESCLKSYEDNKCHPHQRVPALNDYCLDLELCLNSDPRKVAKRSAAFSVLVAENANKLFGTLKLQTIIVICVLLFGSIISCNLFLSRDRASRASLHHQKMD